MPLPPPCNAMAMAMAPSDQRTPTRNVSATSFCDHISRFEYTIHDKSHARPPCVPKMFLVWTICKRNSLLPPTKVQLKQLKWRSPCDKAHSQPQDTYRCPQATAARSAPFFPSEDTSRHQPTRAYKADKQQRHLDHETTIHTHSHKRPLGSILFLEVLRGKHRHKQQRYCSWTASTLEKI